jgi:hypothetical protein
LDGKRGTYSLATSFPDSTPLDVFFWGFVKDTVHGEKLKSSKSERSA